MSPLTHWLGNSGTWERRRRECSRYADEAKREGAYARARRWQLQADEWERRRDEEQRREEIRILNRRARRRGE